MIIKFIEECSFEKYGWFNPDDADSIINIDNKELFVFELSEQVLGFEHIKGTKEYIFSNYNVYTIEGVA